MLTGPRLDFSAPLIPGTLIRRYKRFLADVELDDGRVVVAHCPNTGSMKGCAEAGSRVYLSESTNPKRKLAYTWELVEANGCWVGIHTGRANGVVEHAIRKGRIPELDGHASIRREVKYGKNSRIDLLLETGERKTWVEVKNTTLEQAGTARFPDAVTERGKKHMEELAKMVKNGDEAAVVFLVHRDDCARFAPADDIDPAYGKALRKAARAGVKLLPYQACVTPKGVTVERRLPVDL